MNRLRIAVHSALYIYVIRTSPTLLESVFHALSPSASGLGIGHTQTKIWPFKCSSQLAAIDLTLFVGVPLPEASFGKPIVARLLSIRVHLSPGSSCGLLAYASAHRYYNFPHICG